jgi:hypothetical protein
MINFTNVANTLNIMYNYIFIKASFKFFENSEIERDEHVMFSIYEKFIENLL